MSVVKTEEEENDRESKEKKQKSSKEEVDPVLQYPKRSCVA